MIINEFVDAVPLTRSIHPSTLSFENFHHSDSLDRNKKKTPKHTHTHTHMHKKEFVENLYVHKFDRAWFTIHGFISSFDILEIFSRYSI